LNDQSNNPETPSRPPPHPVDNTASYGRRFGAFLLDGLFMVIAMMFFMQYIGLTDIAPEAAKDPEAMQAALLAKMTALSSAQKTLLMMFPFIAFFALHGYLLSRYGQTLGKRILGIAIVTLDNRVPPFFQLITQRYLTQWLAGMIPFIGLFLRLVDILAIFRPDRRCIHDHLAKTKVIDLRIRIDTPDSPVASSSLIV
jgi:uncharacterized RDD family membrane protein YckC